MHSKLKLPLDKPPKSICILRLSAIGDVTHVVPVVRAIQKQWPETKITWVCGKFEYKLLRIFDDIRFVLFDKGRGYKSYIDLWREIGKERFDVLLHMQVAARANIASLAVKADIRLGWDLARSRDFHQVFINHRVPTESQQHQVQGFLSFARALGLQADVPEWNIPVTDNAQTFVEKHVNEDKPLMVISACSSHELRNWQAEGYAEVADYEIKKYDMQVVLSGGPANIEKKMAKKITEHMNESALNLVGMDTLEELTGLLRAADVVITPDSGPAHMANAVGVPVIGLYACTWAKRSGPYNSVEYCVDKFELAADKFLNKNADELRWGTKIEKPGVMQLIEVSEVCQKLDLIMSAST